MFIFPCGIPPVELCTTPPTRRSDFLFMLTIANYTGIGDGNGTALDHNRSPLCRRDLDPPRLRRRRRTGNGSPPGCQGDLPDETWDRSGRLKTCPTGACRRNSSHSHTRTLRIHTTTGRRRLLSSPIPAAPPLAFPFLITHSRVGLRCSAKGESDPAPTE